jgi:hypothetical protein
LLAAAVLVTAALGQSAPPPVLQLGLHSGEQAPGLPEGFTLFWISAPGIGPQGNLLVVAILDGPEVHSGNGAALFYGPPGGMTKFLWESEQCPGMPAGVVVGPALINGSLNVTKSGWFVLGPWLDGPGIVPGVNDHVLLVGPPGDMVKVMQAGDQAPGCESGVYIDGESTSFGGMLTDDGTEEGEHWLLVCADLAGPGVTSQNDRAYWAGTRDNLHLIYREGMQAPGYVFAFTDVQDVIVSDAGQVAFKGNAAGAGRWIGGPDWTGADPLTMLVHDGLPVAGMPEGLTWRYSAGCSTELNIHGHMPEGGTIRGPGVTTANDRVMFFKDDSGYHLMHREGDPMPEVGPGVTLSAPGGGWINNRGEALYYVGYAGTGISDANRWAIYFGPLGAAQQTLRDSDPAPTFNVGILLSRVSGMTDAAMNEVGDVVGPTLISGPGVTDKDKVVLWLRHHVLQRWTPLLRSGSTYGPYTIFAQDQYDFAYGYACATGGADGKGRSFDNRAVLGMKLQLADGTHAVFRITSPFGDMDRDGDVDSLDWVESPNCWSGPGQAVAPGCEALDLDGDGDVDLADLAMFQQLAG